jgi:hypothetical protein
MPSVCGHRGDGDAEDARIWSGSPSVLWEFDAAGVPRNSTAGDSRQPELPCPCPSWPKGGPPQQQVAGCSSTSRRDADVEAIQLLLAGVAPSHRPK